MGNGRSYRTQVGTRRSVHQISESERGLINRSARGLAVTDRGLPQTGVQPPHGEAKTRPIPGQVRNREAINSVENRLGPLFGNYWPRVRRILERRMHPDIIASNFSVNWKLILVDQSLPFRNPLMPLRGRLHTHMLSNVRITHLKAESGVYINHRNNRSQPTVGLNLANGQLSIGASGVRVQQGAMEFVTPEMTFGDWEITAGVNYRVLNPFSSGTSWKVGCENKRQAIVLNQDYVSQHFLELGMEGDLSFRGRVELGGRYYVGAVSASAIATIIVYVLGLALTSSAGGIMRAAEPAVPVILGAAVRARAAASVRL